MENAEKTHVALESRPSRVHYDTGELAGRRRRRDGVHISESGGPIVPVALMGSGRDSGILAGLQAALNARLGTKGPISETNNKIQLTMKRKKFFWCAPQRYPNGTRGDNFPKDLGLPLFLGLEKCMRSPQPSDTFTTSQIIKIMKCSTIE
ncbi:hypothetical protein RR46_13305 [Papilio xuthus]|uniref:Uncharacterized protein n=1 Tax=Papilio xuthus TaxID=66420 RepID=A0A194PHA0_PAPXU|nr:hypothetical protein RR46_13305 [Papilio xuthus]